MKWNLTVFRWCFTLILLLLIGWIYSPLWLKMDIGRAKLLEQNQQESYFILEHKVRDLHRFTIDYIRDRPEDQWVLTAMNNLQDHKNKLSDEITIEELRDFKDSVLITLGDKLTKNRWVNGSYMENMADLFIIDTLRLQSLSERKNKVAWILYKANLFLAQFVGSSHNFNLYEPVLNNQIIPYTNIGTNIKIWLSNKVTQPIDIEVFNQDVAIEKNLISILSTGKIEALDISARYSVLKYKNEHSYFDTLSVRDTLFVY